MKRTSFLAVCALVLISIYAIGAMAIPNSEAYAIFSPLVALKSAASNGFSTVALATSSSMQDPDARIVSRAQLKNGTWDSALFAIGIASCTAFFTISWPFKKQQSRVSDIKRAMGEADADLQIPFKKGVEHKEDDLKDDATVKRNLEGLLGQLTSKPKKKL